MRFLKMKYKLLSFEDELTRIDEINSILSVGNTSLDASIKLYEEASERIQHCKQLLNEAELKVTTLSSSLEDNEEI